MCPKMIDREEKVKEIAAAALALFSQKGYPATSVGQIAQAAGIGKGTIYDYFNTKEEIFIASIMEWLTQFDIRLTTQLEDPIIS